MTNSEQALNNWLDIIKPMTNLTGKPKYALLRDSLGEAIRAGKLAEGARLPTNRKLAGLLNIDRSTVARAYEELEKEGLIYSHVGRGTFVRLLPPVAEQSSTGRVDSTPMVWTDKYSNASKSALETFNRQVPPRVYATEVISFAGGVPAEDSYPLDDFRKIVNKLIKSDNYRDLFSYSPAEGHPLLIEQVKNYLARQGTAVEDDELMIISGSQQGIDLVARTFIDPGDQVLIEDPTYFWSILKFNASQSRMLPVPVRNDGMDLKVLESYLLNHRAKLLYLMPTHQNPTGSSMPYENRVRLIQLARKFQLPVLEDNFASDLNYEGRQLPSLRSLDKDNNIVIQQGTFSKSLCPGLRLGFLAGPREVIGRLRLAKRSCDLSTNSMAQAIMADYLRQGLYEKHLEQTRETYKLRRDALCNALDKHLAGIVSYTAPEGGLFVWARLPDGASARELLAYAEREGVTFSPGDTFYAGTPKREFFRLTFIQEDKKRIREGIRRLARASNHYLKERISWLAKGSNIQVNQQVLI